MAMNDPRPPQREEVYDAFDSERNYQDARWGEGHGHEVGAFVTYIVEYTNQLVKAATMSVGNEAALNTMRKVGTLCVACMEQHGAPHRKGFERRGRYGEGITPTNPLIDPNNEINVTAIANGWLVRHSFDSGTHYWRILGDRWESSANNTGDWTPFETEMVPSYITDAVATAELNDEHMGFTPKPTLKMDVTLTTEETAALDKGLVVHHEEPQHEPWNPTSFSANPAQYALNGDAD